MIGNDDRQRKSILNYKKWISLTVSIKMDSIPDTSYAVIVSAKALKSILIEIENSKKYAFAQSMAFPRICPTCILCVRQWGGVQVPANGNIEFIYR